jgi:hypothetical protein
MIPHAIRLRHPWDQSPAMEGRVVYLRRFNKPTNLDAWETVTLEIDRAMFRGQIMLNGLPLGPLEVGELFSADVTSQLQGVNELRVEVDPATAADAPPPTSTIYVVEASEPPGSPIGDVRLVIRAVQVASELEPENRG